MELLLVEDDPADCREMLEAIDDNADDFYPIGVTNSADKAFDYIMEYHPDAVILDLELSLGSGNGLDVLTRLKAENLSRPPFILVTTNSVSTLTHKASRDFGADFIMTKSQQGLFGEIRSVLPQSDEIHHLQPQSQGRYAPAPTFPRTAGKGYATQDHERAEPRRYQPQIDRLPLSYGGDRNTCQGRKRPSYLSYTRAKV